MAKVELIMPKMGESIIEATILKWVKQVGDTVEVDETILEIATDKVDSEVPSPVKGKIAEILFEENETVDIGKVIAVIATEGEEIQPSPAVVEAVSVSDEPEKKVTEESDTKVGYQPQEVAHEVQTVTSTSDRFYSPLVRNIAKKEGIAQAELDGLPGTGQNGRVTKRDILAYVASRGNNGSHQERTRPAVEKVEQKSDKRAASDNSANAHQPAVVDGNVEIVEMDRMRKLIADHMVRSKQTSPHVTSFVEADVTELVNWRNRVKGPFQEKYGEKITFTPMFIQAVVRAIQDFPMINISVDGDSILVKKDINIGMAAALPSGNLIVPVIKNADFLNLVGLTKTVNDFANRARNNALKPDEIQGGTFTLTNVGTFGNVMGTPIINQPQVAILATGAIRKKPAVIETPHGDLIGIRQMMFLSLSYDHRVVDGFLGGSFLRKVADYLEAFDPETTI